ncbi:urease accessory protein UreE [Massilia sp. PWRC2]|uniref:urease accessory protein UreE n=1 Tax=Massilia sp. PWRC2 TaxID=2804626 RepID=UPI003CED4936
MLTFHSKIKSAAALYGTLVLPYDQREKCRLRARLESGEEVAIFTVRGTLLRDGDLLTGEHGQVVQVLAALEPTYAVHCDSEHALVRCAYHLGNRHTQVAISAGVLRMRVDPVLKEMVEGLGARVLAERAVFEPEAGAYAGAHAGAGHSHASDLLAPVPLRQRIHRPGDPA